MTNLVKPGYPISTDEANASAVAAMSAAEPALVGVQPALEAISSMTSRTVLVSGPPLQWTSYTGRQRSAILGACLYEGLARTERLAAEALESGDVLIRSSSDYSCVAPFAGVVTASMPVVVVTDSRHGHRAYATLYEGPTHHSLNYGTFNDQVRTELLRLRDKIAPIFDRAIADTGPIKLRPIIRQALMMGDDMHGCTRAATLLLHQALASTLVSLASSGYATQVRTLVRHIALSPFFFLRVSLAACKAIAMAAHGVPLSTIVTDMASNCRQFAIRVSSLGDAWSCGPLPTVRARLFGSATIDEVEWLGGASNIAETVGLGSFASAAAFAVGAEQGLSSTEVVRANLAMYAITTGEHPEWRIPYLDFRGTPIGIDVAKVISTGVLPVLSTGVVSKKGYPIGAGVFEAPRDCFESAAAALRSAQSPRTDYVSAGESALSGGGTSAAGQTSSPPMPSAQSGEPSGPT